MADRHSQARTGIKLRAVLFGSFRLFAPNGNEISISGRRSQALLAMLCLQPGIALEREQCCQLLWPGKFSAHARASLRQILLGLKQQLTPLRADFLEITRERVSVNADAVRSDLDELEQTLGHGSEASASKLLLSIAGKPLLDQLDLGEPFRQWLEVQRAQVDQRLQRAVEAAIADCQQRGDGAAAGQLREAWRLHGSTAALSGADRRVRIAVLPFQTQGADDWETSIVQGLFDELITTLGQVPELLVAGRTSSLNARKLAHRLPRIAQALNVAYLLEGSIQYQAESVRVHVSLIDGLSGFELWSHSHQGTLSDVFTLQADIAGNVTRELSQVLKLEIQPPAQRTTTSLAAYGLYMQGRALTVRAIGEGVLARAVELLEQSLKIDPGFAAGWTALAEAHVNTAVYTPCLDRVGQSEIMAKCAQKAIELDPGQGHARAMLGIHRWTENDPVGALDLAHEAYRLEPDNPDVVLRLGSFLLYIGRTREALPYIEAAIDMDPVNARNFGMLSVAHLNLGHIDQAIVAGQRMVDLGLPAMWLAVATAAAGDHKLAVELYRQTRLLMNTVIFPPAGTRPLPGPALRVYWQIAARGVCSGSQIHRKVYCTLLDHLHATLPDPGDTSIVAPAIWMGYAEMVFKTLGQQITPANMYCLMSLWADIEPIRQIRLHREFLPFAKRIGLVAAWEKYGWPDLLAAPDSRIPQS
ncbi:MAG: tetratricopeptide repeat protein [Wenzhouxiangella sp.]|nr:tetratricopeptide repeat protein [Wenzhouxiangella sp.]